LLAGTVADLAKNIPAAEGLHELFAKPSPAGWEPDHVGDDGDSPRK
jgi:hypothetical protein